MKTIRFAGLAALLFFVTVISETLHAQEYPKATGYVNDFAQLLTKEEGESLNQELVDFEKKTSIEIAVVTVNSLKGETIESYTQRLAAMWGVGKPDKNNGVMFLIAVTERKMRIQTASGSREILTDALADKIRNDVILPHLKANEWSAGIIEGTRAIMGTFDQPVEQTAADGSTFGSWITENATPLIYSAIGLVIMIVLFLFFAPRIRRLKARTYVLEKIPVFAERLRGATKTILHADIKDKKICQKFEALKSDFLAIRGFTAEDNADWVAVREELERLESEFDNLIFSAEREISSAEQAREKAPELLKNFPEMLAAAKKKIGEGKQSKKAQEQLDAAHAKYVEAQNQQSSSTDWLLIYLLLNDANSNVTSAESYHRDENYSAYSNHSNHSGYADDNLTHNNTQHHSSYADDSLTHDTHHSDSSNDTSTSFDFGSNSDFSGGGGFDSGGGGSSGDF